MSEMRTLREAQRAADTTSRLIESRRASALHKRKVTEQVIARLLETGQQLNLTQIARHAGVSTWLIYNTPELRVAAFEAIRMSQRSELHESREAKRGKASDLALAMKRISSLQSENKVLRDKARLSLGAAIERTATGELIDRVNRQETEIAALKSERDNLLKTNSKLNRGKIDAVEELEAVRALNRELMSTNNARL